MGRFGLWGSGLNVCVFVRWASQTDSWCLVHTHRLNSSSCVSPRISLQVRLASTLPLQQLKMRSLISWETCFDWSSSVVATATTSFPSILLQTPLCWEEEEETALWQNDLKAPEETKWSSSREVQEGCVKFRGLCWSRTWSVISRCSLMRRFHWSRFFRSVKVRSQRIEKLLSDKTFTPSSAAVYGS